MGDQILRFYEGSAGSNYGLILLSASPARMPNTTKILMTSSSLISTVRQHNGDPLPTLRHASRFASSILQTVMLVYINDRMAFVRV